MAVNDLRSSGYAVTKLYCVSPSDTSMEAEALAVSYTPDIRRHEHDFASSWQSQQNSCQEKALFL